MPLSVLGTNRHVRAMACSLRRLRAA